MGAVFDAAILVAPTREDVETNVGDLGEGSCRAEGHVVAPIHGCHACPVRGRPCAPLQAAARFHLGDS
jgi:hypothetical protein